MRRTIFAASLTILLSAVAGAQDREEPGPETTGQEAPEPESPEIHSSTDAAVPAPEDDRQSPLPSKRQKDKPDEASRLASEQEELAALRREAEAEAAVAPAESQQAEETEFTSANRALQGLNPELSVVGDAGGKLIMDDTDPETIADKSGFFFRVLGIHFESVLDPFSFFKAAVGVKPAGVGLGEAYATWTDALPNTSLTVGKFRQQFGVINRWHVPSLDQWDFPLPLTTVLGPEGLNQIGVSLDWAPPPLWAHNQVLTLQLTNGMNEHLFSGEYVGIPCVLIHVLSYYDLTEQTYLELGLSSMLGWNNRRGMTEEILEPAYDAEGNPIWFYDGEGNQVEPVTVVAGERRVDEPWSGHSTWLAGADLTLSWSPLHRERFEGVTWRSEYYFARRDRPDGEMIRVMGAYTYLDWRLSESWVLGARGDVTQPFAPDNDDKLIWQGVGYATWWQSPWVKFRLQYAHRWGDEIPDLDQLVLQVVFAAGPHKHERY